MEQIYQTRINELGYDQFVCDIFANWEGVKDEILDTDRKVGTANGTVHIYIGSADSCLKEEFPAYYENVYKGGSPSEGAPRIKHYFMPTNIISMLGFSCKKMYEANEDFKDFATNIICLINNATDEAGFITTFSDFRLSKNKNQFRPYFKQFDLKGAFHQIVRPLLFPDSSYKISLYKNEEGEYAAFWLLGFENLTNFEADPNSKYISSSGDYNNRLRCVVSETQLNTFILSCVKFINSIDTLDALVPYAYNNPPIKISKDGLFNLVGMFLETDIDDVKKRNEKVQRWFENPFILGGKKVYLSTQWNAQGDYNLLLSDFLEMLRSCYGNFHYQKGANGEHQLFFADNRLPLQQVYYGTPGSGKSWKIKKLYEMKLVKGEYVEDEEMKKHVIRTTFHPDTDYASFVGCYKPQKGDNDKITYKFAPQAFTEAYVKAWSCPDEDFYLVIEEINRGNCAQIFGDLFQLLDRNDKGFSEYPIKADIDLRDYLEDEVVIGKKGIEDGKLCLPPNLSIIASMNTSDQSLFPMDSAFKRRWTWEYVPIEYDNPLSSKFDIKIDGDAVPWPEFLKLANDKIKKVTASEDKQMGNFFIKHSVNEKEFCDKVMFYIWSEVGKDNYATPDAIFKWVNDKGQSNDFSFNELYESAARRKELLKGFIKYLKSENGIESQVENVETE